MVFVKAERKQSKARVALAGPSGSGKSYSALQLTKGLVPGGKIAAIDTENGSLSLYSDVVDFDVCELTDYSPEGYIRTIHEAEKAGYDALIIDSLSHEWLHLLNEHEKMPGNSFANWGKITPRHQALIAAMVESPCHIIATMRSKTAYIQAEKNGKTEIQKAGMAPQQRDGMEYEFTVTFDLDNRHIASCDKDRSRLFDGKHEVLTEEHGKRLREWLDGGAAPAPKPAASAQAAKPAPKTPPGLPAPSDKTDWARIHTVAAQVGLSADGYKLWLTETLGVDSSKLLNKEGIASAIDAMQTTLNAESVKDYNDRAAKEAENGNDDF